MDQLPRPTRFASRLLQQEEILSDEQYLQYRNRLESALESAKRRERWTFRVVILSCIASFVLIFVGGSKLLGDFDPWSKDATAASIAAGVGYWVALSIFLVSLASYYSRFRPGTREARERLRDASILDLQRQVHELRQQLAASPPPNREEPNPR